MFCSKCGNQITGYGMFCSNCGAAVKPENKETAPAGDAYMESTGDTPAQNKAGKEKGKGGRRGRIAIILAVVLAAALAAGGALYFTSDDYRCGKNLKLAGECYEAEKYEEALEHCAAVLELDGAVGEAYRLSSDIYLAQDKCIEAVQALIDGEAATEGKDMERLAEREEYLRENIVVVREECIYISYNEDGSVVRQNKDEKEYDERGNQTKYVYYEEDGSVDEWVEYENEYDERGNLTKCVSYNADGSIKRWYEYEYDEWDNQTKYVSYNADGSVGNWYEYEYDDQGNETKEVSYNADGSVRWREEYEYDDQGNETKRVRYNADDWREYENEYDERGNLTKQMGYYVDYYGRSLLMWYEYEYDEWDNQTKYVVYNDDGSVRRWEEYEYDVMNSKISRFSSDSKWYAAYQYHYIGNDLFSGINNIESADRRSGETEDSESSTASRDNADTKESATSFTIRNSQGEVEAEVSLGYSYVMSTKTMPESSGHSAEILIPTILDYSTSDFAMGAEQETDGFYKLSFKCNSTVDYAFMDTYIKDLESLGFTLAVSRKWNSGIFGNDKEYYLDYSGNITHGAVSRSDLVNGTLGYVSHDMKIYTYTSAGYTSVNFVYPKEVGFHLGDTEPECLSAMVSTDYSYWKGKDRFAIRGWGKSDDDYIIITFDPNIYQTDDIIQKEDFLAQSNAGSSSLCSAMISGNAVSGEKYGAVFVDGMDYVKVTIVERSDSCLAIKYDIGVPRGSSYYELSGVCTTALAGGSDAWSAETGNSNSSGHNSTGKLSCSACGGSGIQICSFCGGAGFTKCHKCGGGGLIKQGYGESAVRCRSCTDGRVYCTSCNWKGYKNCVYCGGDGILIHGY